MSVENSFWTEQEIRERLSISTLVFYQFQPLCERSLKELTKHGISRIELLDSQQQFDITNRGSMKLMGDLFKSCGIKVIAYHAHHTHFTDIDSEEARSERVSICKRQIDTLMELGGTVWGSHTGKPDSYAMKSYEELARYVEGTDVMVTIENFGSPETHVQQRVAFLDKINHKNVGMILDIGHVRNDQGRNPMTIPGGPAEIINMCGKHLKHLHLHGFKNGRDHHPPLIEGDTIQWVELFIELRDVKYAGAINFEPSGEPTLSETLEYTTRFPSALFSQMNTWCK